MDGDHPNNHPIKLELDFGMLEDQGPDSPYLLIIRFPELKKIRNLAVLVGVFFENGWKPRYLLGKTDYEASRSFYLESGHVGRQIYLVELTSSEGQYSRKNFGSFTGNTPMDERNAFVANIAEPCHG